MSGDTQLQPIVFNPGIRKDLTEYMAEGGWVDCDNIRFRNGRAEKRGGYVRETVSQAVPLNKSFGSSFSIEFQSESNNENTFTGVARDIITWSALDGTKYMAVGSNIKVELMTGNQIFDITPYRDTNTVTNGIATTSGFSEVTIHDVNHGAVVGDYIFIDSQAAPYNGINLLGQYQVITLVDADHYIIDSATAASGTGAGGGGDLVVNYMLENGAQDNGNLTGWGGGTWGTEGAGAGGWGEPRAGVGGLNLRQWSFDNWGEDLMACVRGGAIYHWIAADGPTSRLEVISAAPATNSFILVSQPTRHLIAFGSEVFTTSEFDPLIIRWADQETFDVWDITLTNSAGEYRLPSGNFIVGAVQTRSEIIIFTDSDVYSMTYVGGNDIFQITPIGTNTSVVSQHSFIDVNGTLFWQGIGNFYMYDGVIHILPCTLNKYIFDQDGAGRINFGQKEKSFAGVISDFNEIIFLYPRFDESEVGHYIKYNYIEQVFDFGTLDRTVWRDRDVFDKPYAVAADGTLYVEETGHDADGSPLVAYIRSAYFDIGDGQELSFIDRIIPDINIQTNQDLKITLYFKQYPHPNATITTKGPYIFNDSVGKVSVRGRGRQMAIQYLVDSTNSIFEIGKVRVGIQSDGGR